MHDDDTDSMAGRYPNRSGPDGDADFRGRYGYGRPAHKPDPAAKYGFAPDPKRTLPPSGEIAVIGPAGDGEADGA